MFSLLWLFNILFIRFSWFSCVGFFCHIALTVLLSRNLWVRIENENSKMNYKEKQNESSGKKKETVKSQQWKKKTIRKTGCWHEIKVIYVGKVLRKAMKIQWNKLKQKWTNNFNINFLLSFQFFFSSSKTIRTNFLLNLLNVNNVEIYFFLVFFFFWWCHIENVTNGQNERNCYQNHHQICHWTIYIVKIAEMSQKKKQKNRKDFQNFLLHIFFFINDFFSLTHLWHMKEKLFQ